MASNLVAMASILETGTAALPFHWGCIMCRPSTSNCAMQPPTAQGHQTHVVKPAARWKDEIPHLHRLCEVVHLAVACALALYLPLCNKSPTRRAAACKHNKGPRLAGCLCCGSNGHKKQKVFSMQPPQWQCSKQPVTGEPSRCRQVATLAFFPARCFLACLLVNYEFWRND